MKKTLCIMLVLLLVVLNAGGVAEQAPGITDYSTLTVGSLTPATGSFFLDNLFGNNATDMDIRDLLHGYPLTEWNAGTGTYAVNGNVVSGIVAMENGMGDRTYEIAIRRDLSYSDGTPITAWDYAFSILLSIAPEMEAIGAVTDRSGKLLGAAEYQDGETAYFAGVEVIDDYLLNITVCGEFLPYFNEPALLSYKPYPIHVIAPGCEVAQTEDGIYIRDASGGQGNPFTAELLTNTILDPESGYLSRPTVVSGPYKPVSFDPESGRVELTVNEHYKGNSAGVLPRIRNLVFVPVTNEDGVAKLRSGEITLFNKAMNAGMVKEGLTATTEGSLNMSGYPRVGLGFISFDCRRPEVSETAVRQAIALCFDRDAFIGDYMGENGVKANGYYGIGQWMYTAAVAKTAAYPVAEPGENATDAEKKAYAADKVDWEALNADNVRTYDKDVEAAKKLLDDNGWAMGADGIRSKEIDGQTVRLELALACSAEAGNRELFERDLVPELAEAGIRLTVTEMPAGELLAQYYGNTERTCQMFCLASNFMADFDPSQTFLPEGGVNFTGIRDEELFDRAVDMRRTQAGKVTEYCRKWIAFQERFMEVLPMIPIYSNAYFDFYSPELQEYSINNRMTLGQALSEAFYGPVPAAK